MLFAAAAIESCAKHGNDLQHVIGQFLLKRRLVAFVDNHDLNALYVTKRKDQLSPEPEQPVLVELFIKEPAS